MKRSPLRRVRPSRRGSSLRRTAFLWIGSALLVVFGIYTLAVSSATLRSFDKLQEELTKEWVEHLIRGLDHVADRQAGEVLEHASSDELFKALSSRKKVFSPGQRTTIREEGVADAVLLFDSQKNLFDVLSTQAQGRAATALPEGLDPEEFRKTDLLHGNRTMSALLASPQGLLVLSASPVLRSDGSGPSPGWLVYVRLLDRQWLAEAIRIEATVQTLFPYVKPASKELVRTSTSRTPRLGEIVIFSNGMLTLLEFPSFPTRSPAQIQLSEGETSAHLPREIRRTLIWHSILGGLLIMGASFLVVDSLFVRRIERMNRDFDRLANTEEADVRLDESGHDDFSRLAESVNGLLELFRRRRREAETQQKLLASVLDSASEGIMAFRTQYDEDGTIDDFVMVMANKAAERMVKRPASELLGQRLLTIFPGNRTAGLFERYCRVVNTGQPESHEFFYEHDGLSSWFQSSTAPWSDGFVVTFEEITRRKTTEQELQQRMEEIERFNRAMIGREERILEMKTEVNQLRAKLGLPPAYHVDSTHHGL